MFPQGGSVEATQDHVVIHILSGVLYGDIVEQTTVYPKDIICPGLHLPPLMENSLHTSIPRPWYVARGGVACHFLEAQRCNCRKDHLVVGMSVRFRDFGVGVSSD